MDKEILNYLDKVGQYLQGAGEKGFETYVHGVWVSSLIYATFGIILICIGVMLIKMAWKLSKKRVYTVIPEKESFSVFGEKRIIPERQTRDDEEEERNSYIALGMIFASIPLIFFGIVFVIANTAGLFAPDYVAIKELVHDIGGK